MFALMDIDGDKRIDRIELAQFFSKAGSDSQAQKLTRFIGSKNTFDILDLRRFYEEEMRQGASEAVLTTILNQMINSCRAENQ